MTALRTSPAGTRSSLMAFAALCGLALTGTLCVEMAWLGRGSEPVLLAILFCVAAAPAVQGWLTRSFDPFEPVYAIAVAASVYFILMPVLLLTSARVEMLGTDYGGELPSALFLALLALSTFYVGYYVVPQTSRAEAEEMPDRRTVRRITLVLLALSALLFALWIVLARIPLRTLIIFSGAGYGAWVDAATGPKWGHLYALQEVWPACILLLLGSSRTRSWLFSPAIVLIIVVAIYSSLGVRARVLFAVCGAFSFHYIIRGARPSLVRLGVFGLLFLVLVIGGIGYYRGAPPDSGGPNLGVSTGWAHLVEGSDIATTTSVYVHWLRRYGFEGPRNFLELALLPIPRAIWPDKYKYFGESHIEKHLTTGAAAAYFIELYRDFGSVFVAFGSAALGYLFRRVYERSRRSGASIFDHAYLALLWAYAFHMYGRNSVTLLIGGAVFVFGPVWLCRRLALVLGRDRNVSVTVPEFSLPGRF